MATDTAPPRSAPFGDLLRDWRQRRRLSQLDLAVAAGVSTKHLSFLETGRAGPSREMIVHLAEHLEVPLRERNVLLTAAGYAPAYPQRPLDAPELGAVREAIDIVLRGHEPYPAVAVDRAWNLVAMNAAASVIAGMLPPSLLEPPANVYRLSLHPEGLARHVVNVAEFGHHLLTRLRHDAAVSGDPALTALLAEVEDYGTVRGAAPPLPERGAVVTPMRLRHPRGELALFTTVATFGTPVDVTVDELAIEMFFPMDDATAQRLRDLAEERAS